MERTLCTNGKRDDYFEDQVATSANFTKKTGFWIKETVEQPDLSDPFIDPLADPLQGDLHLHSPLLEQMQKAIVELKPKVPAKDKLKNMLDDFAKGPVDEKFPDKLFDQNLPNENASAGEERQKVFETAPKNNLPETNFESL